MKRGLYCLMVAVLMAGLVLGCAPAPKAEPITLKLVTFLPTRLQSNHFVGVFADKVNERANGELTIDWVGGPEVIPSFDQPEAVRGGAIDMVFVPAPFYQAMIPEGSAIFLSQYTPVEEREMGFNDWMVELHKEKMNAYFLGRVTASDPFYIYLNKRVERPQDLAGLKLRVEPGLSPFAEALGMIPVALEGPELYSAMERGVIDAYQTKSHGLKRMAWHEVTKYFVDHGYYGGTGMLLVNLDAWNKIPKHLQDLMIDVQIENEPEIFDFNTEISVTGRQETIDLGLEAITFSPDDAKWFLDVVYGAAWDVVKAKVSPESYAKLNKFLVK